MISCSLLSLDGENLGNPDLPWRGKNGVLPFALEDVQPRASNFAAKFNVDGVAGKSATIGQAGARLTIAWDETIPALAIWLTYGGWPQQDGGHYEVALEPSSTMGDHIGNAIERGVPLQPGERRDWRVTLTVSE